jgi:hypothetical protein
VASGSAGAFRSTETTVLITAEEMMEGLRRAQKVTYSPPAYKDELPPLQV